MSGATAVGTAPDVVIRRLAIARAISQAGSMAAYTALIDLVYRRTEGSTVTLSLTALLTMGAAGLFGPLGGAIADRWDRKRAMVASDLVTGALFVVLALVHPVWALLAVAFLGAVASTPFRAGSAAAVPNLVRDPALIARANGRMAMGSNLGITLGPALGGLMVGAVGAGWVFVVNAVSFVVSAALVASISAPFQADRSLAPASGAARGDWLVGFRFIARDRVLWVGTLAWVVLLLGMSIGIVADRPIAEEFDVGSRGFGVMLGLYGVGAVMGAWRASRLGRDTEPRALVLGFVLAGGAGLLIGTAGAFAVVIVGNFVWGIGDAITTVARSGVVQRRTPDAIRGRVAAANETVVHLALMVGFLAAGPAIDVLGPRGAYAVSGASALIAATLTATIVAAARSTVEPATETATVAP